MHVSILGILSIDQGRYLVLMTGILVTLPLNIRDDYQPGMIMVLSLIMVILGHLALISLQDL